MTNVELVNYRSFQERAMNVALDRGDFPSAYAARVIHRMCVEELDARELASLEAV
ncbi:hypothetical protein N8J89_08035 [Crossiella sp. CA-258035]|uniref:hypothetical protein n=1 Tax=Crossiella sp. CA-258035 TaxID=2981138 RepID=UPI0024BC8279|nr:hypothetical protein [Crossiella sp. CA-258035]WHT21004.1 hypothetical protein N8J89_08035 [Crossiella sp. CA-258035]